MVWPKQKTAVSKVRAKINRGIQPANENEFNELLQVGRHAAQCSIGIAPDTTGRYR